MYVIKLFEMLRLVSSFSVIKYQTQYSSSPEVYFVIFEIKFDLELLEMDAPNEEDTTLATSDLVIPTSVQGHSTALSNTINSVLYSCKCFTRSECVLCSASECSWWFRFQQDIPLALGPHSIS